MPRFFDLNINPQALEDIAQGFEVTTKQYQSAILRASKKTAGTFRRLISKEKLGLDDLRRTVAIRRRIKGLVRRGGNTKNGLWFGFNDLWASEFKGTPVQMQSGVRFRNQFYPNAFRLKKKGTRAYGIFRREGQEVKEIGIPIDEKATNYLQSILPQLADAFYDHFLNALKFYDIKAKS